MKKLLLACAPAAAVRHPGVRRASIWATKDQANDWYGKPEAGWWAANYIPANAINELEMWQGASFDPARIDQELGWARAWA